MLFGVLGGVGCLVLLFGCGGVLGCLVYLVVGCTGVCTFGLCRFGFLVWCLFC